jgi:hypothetical protein
MAYIPYHWKFTFDAATFPTANECELALLDEFVFLLIACRRRTGMASVDGRRAPGAHDWQGRISS